MEKKKGKHTVFSALVWKFLERVGVLGSQFVVQIILARVLDPEHYGVLSLMIVFTTLANVFIQRGFNTSLIQNKDVDEDDYSTVFWITMAIAVVLYVVLYFSAPLIARVYKMPDLVQPFRVLCLLLLPGALNSIQMAKVSRKLDFKHIFRSNLLAIGIAGGAGIALAYLGAGLWALVVQHLLNVTVACIVMWFTVRWRPKWHCDLKRAKTLFSYGWKLLVSGLMDTLYQDLRSLVIGLKYDSGTLGYYNRGKHFPQYVNNAINSTLNSVMLPAFAQNQTKEERVKSMMRNSIMLSSFVIFPMMAGLAGVATPLVRILLTDKWLPCVPYMQIYCFTFAFYPIHTCNLQAINAMGRSDIYLKLEVIKKIMGISALTLAVFCFDSPIAIAATGIFTGLISTFINASPNKKLVGYTYREQIYDMLPAMVLSIVMFAGVLMLSKLPLGDFALIAVQMVCGAVFYITAAAVLRLKSFGLLMDALKRAMNKKHKSEAQA